MPENAHKAKEFGQASAWVADAYAGALVFLWCFIWRYNHRVFPVQHRRWDRSFMCRRCGEDNPCQRRCQRTCRDGQSGYTNYGKLAPKSRFELARTQRHIPIALD